MKKVYNVPAPSSTAFQYGNIFANSDKRDGIKFNTIAEDVCDLLNQVWESYGHFSADELEFLSHREDPWRNARKGIPNGAPCVNEISPYEILVYYSGLE